MNLALGMNRLIFLGWGEGNEIIEESDQLGNIQLKSQILDINESTEKSFVALFHC